MKRKFEISGGASRTRCDKNPGFMVGSAECCECGYFYERDGPGRTVTCLDEKYCKGREMTKAKQWKCQECGKILNESELLMGKNPFDLTEYIIGCPHCYAIECFTEICGVEECAADATCGFMTKDGYRRTCGEHFRKADGK
jgi:hypothetical protein